MSTTVQSILGIVASVALSGLIALAASTHSVESSGVPAFLICVAIAFVIQWIMFIPSWIFQTEHFYDLTGGITYLLVTLVAALLATQAGTFDGRGWLLAVLVVPWAVRLSTFLFLRVLAAGSDRRFNKIKQNFAQLLMTWTMQGMWVSITLSAALAAITSDAPQPAGIAVAVGLAIWVVGFAIEVVADHQKSVFRRDPANAERFINTGLWRWSRHPNYFGEIVLWTGVTIIALPVLQGWQLVTLIAPIFVIVLLTQISGIPMLERRADARWGRDPDYQQYKDSTSVLIPMPPST